MKPRNQEAKKLSNQQNRKPRNPNQETTKATTKKPRNPTTKKPRNQSFFYFQVRESPAPVNITTPTLANRSGRMARASWRVARGLCLFRPPHHGAPGLGRGHEGMSHEPWATSHEARAISHEGMGHEPSSIINSRLITIKSNWIEYDLAYSM